MLVPLRFSDPQRVPRRLEPGDVARFGAGIGDADDDVDARLRSQSRYGGRADMLDK
jgi:hypothetical protein